VEERLESASDDSIMWVLREEIPEDIVSSS
jgi:hypothetical protein